MIDLTEQRGVPQCLYGSGVRKPTPNRSRGNPVKITISISPHGVRMGKFLTCVLFLKASGWNSKENPPDYLLHGSSSPLVDQLQAIGDRYE